MKKLRIAYMFFLHIHNNTKLTAGWILDIYFYSRGNILYLHYIKSIIYNVLLPTLIAFKKNNWILYKVQKHFYFTQLHTLKYFDVFVSVQSYKIFINICIVLAQGILQLLKYK